MRAFGMAKKIVYIADPEIIAIPIKECHEPLLDLKNQSTVLYGPPPECEATAPDYTKIRKTVYEKLCQAQKNLPQGWRFRIYEGYRSLAVQKLLFEQELQRVKQRIPQASQAEWHYETSRLVSPVRHADGSLNIPPHNTGAAIDLEIINDEGLLLDMGMAAKDWSSVDPDLCLTDSQLANEEAQKNRKLLIEVMQSQGFVNYPTEWWHFSYGDRYWAYHQQAPSAIYGSYG